MNRFLYSIITSFLILLFISCRPQKQKEESISLTHQSVPIKNDYLGKPGQIICIDDKIVGIDMMLDSCLFSIDLKTDSLFRFGKKGGGPEEFVQPYTLQYLDEKHFGMFDLWGRKFCVFSMDGNKISLQHKYNTENEKSALSFTVKQMAKNRFLSQAPYSDAMYVVMDSLGTVLKSFFEFPYKDTDERTIQNRLRGMAYQGPMSFNPSCDRFVYSPSTGDIIHFYAIEGDEVHVVSRLEKAYPRYIPEEGADGAISAAISRSEKFSYIASTATDRYVYLLYSDAVFEDLIKEGKMNSGRTVFVYNWKGEKLRSFALDIDCQQICVSTDDGTLYAIAENPEPELVRFDISPWQK